MVKIEQLALKLSDNLGDTLNKTKEEKAVLNYGLFILMHTTMAILATIFIGVLSGMLIEMLTISIVASLLKRYSGGVHSTTPERCLIMGVILSFTLSIFYKKLIYVVNDSDLIVLIIIGLTSSYYILYKKTPVPSKNKPLNKDSRRRMLRKRAFILMNIYIFSILLLCIIYFLTKMDTIKVIYSSISLGIILQVFSLTSIGHKFVNLLEEVFNIISIFLNKFFIN